jgi:hypothetical protein
MKKDYCHRSAHFPASVCAGTAFHQLFLSSETLTGITVCIEPAYAYDMPIYNIKTIADFA